MNRITYRFLAASWMGIIFVLSSFQQPLGPALFEGQDKLGHVLMYTVLGFLLARALPGGFSITWNRVCWAAFLAFAYGVSDEVHQLFVPGRDCSLQDLAADFLGAGLGAWLAMLVSALDNAKSELIKKTTNNSGSEDLKRR